MQHQEQDPRTEEPLGHQEYPQIPTRRRGRKPPRPTTLSLDGAGAGDCGGEDQTQGWQLHYSSTGHPFYFNCVTGESAWARTAAANSRSAMLGNNRDSNNTSSSLRNSSYKPVLGSRNARNGSGSRSRSGSSGSSSSSSSSGTSLASSSSSGEIFFSRDDSTNNSSETVSTSSASYASTGSNPTSSSGDGDSRSSSYSESSETTSTSSEGSWTESLEARFRLMITSEQGRNLLAEEVEALTARQARHSQRQPARGTTATRRISRRRRNTSMPAARMEGLSGEKDDVEMALLAPETSESGGSSSGSSSGSSDSSSDSSFSLHLSSGSDGGSDLSLLTSDVVLERLEKVEKVLVAVRSTALSVLFTSYMFIRRASIFVGARVWRGTIRARRGLFSGRPRSRSSSFSPATI